MANPTVLLFLLPDGTLCAEAAGRNGARRKIDLGGATLHDLPPGIVAELIDQRDAQARADARERELLLREQRERQKFIHATTWKHHGRPLADRVVPAMAGRRARAGQYDPISGKIVEASSRPTSSITQTITDAAELDI